MFFYIVLTPISTTSGLWSTGNTRKYHQIDVYIYQCDHRHTSEIAFWQYTEINWYHLMLESIETIHFCNNDLQKKMGAVIFALEIKTWWTARDISTEFPSNQEYKSLILSVKFDIDSISQNTITHLLFAHENVFIALNHGGISISSV